MLATGRVRNRREVADAQGTFAGGLNSASAPFQLRSDQVRQAANARVDPFGSMAKRGGTKKLHATALGAPSLIQGGFGWTTTSTQQLVVVNGRLNTGTYAVPIVWTAQGAPADFSTSARVSFAAFRDATVEVAYIADGGLLNKWDGTNVTINIAGTPSVSQIWVYNRRLWGTGDAANPQTIYWSDLDDGDSLGNAAAGGGAAVIRTFGQSNITTGGSLKSSSMIIHRNGISRFTGWSQDDIAIESGTRGVSTEVGTIAPRSFISIENFAFFLSDRGFYLLSEDGVREISRNIDDVIQSLSSVTATTIVVGHHRAFHEVWWFLAGLGFYVYNYERGVWYGPMTSAYLTNDDPPTAMWATSDTNNIPIMLVGTNLGFVYRVDHPSVTTDGVTSAGAGGSGTPFLYVVETRPLFAGSPTDTKAWRWAYVNMIYDATSGNGAATISELTETGSASLAFSQFTAPSVAGNRVYRIPLGHQGPYASITVQDLSQSESPTIQLNRVDVHGYSLGPR